ncbi:MAG: right-handed parallel beta-helix repeat-containing protein, partial [Cytophagales bacterium]|nr:right-handed parallel beta-helix repeat-containing protein [Cytophagales bacterium]
MYTLYHKIHSLNAMRKSISIVISLILLLTTLAIGQTTITVTNTNDSGAGSLRAAITQYIGVGPKTIVFDPTVFNNTSNVITLVSSLNIGYFGVDNNTPLIIDGSTGLNPGTRVKITYPSASGTNQGTFIFNANRIVLSGLDIYGNPNADGIFINAGTSTITNSFIHDNGGNGIYDQGFNNLSITNNYIYSNGKGIASTVANYFSYVSGIRIELPASSGIVISGNTIGTNLSNTTGLGNGFEGITIYGGSNVLVKNNIIVGNGNLNTYVPGGGGIGIRNYTGTVGTNTITGNRIGIDNSGNLNGNWNAGISIEQSNGNFIGSSLSSDGNTIYGTKNGPAIMITEGSQQISGSNNNSILNNTIGNPNSTVAGYSNKGGISIKANSKNNTIGTLLAPNTIANNSNFAINIDGAGSTGNRILGNSTFCNNNNKGISLTANGNANYASGGTTPPNLYINSLDATPGQISGVSPANAIIDVYIQSPCESCGSLPATNYAQGKTWVGSTTANASGAWTYTLSGLATKTNTVVTATDASNNTSEFSACYGVVTCTTPSALFTISTSGVICSTSNTATLSVSGAQVSVAYVPVLNGNTISGSTITATSSNFIMTVPGLSVGNNAIRIIAYNNCTQTTSGLVTVTVNSSPTLTSAIGFTNCGLPLGTVSLTGVNAGRIYSAYIGGILATSSVASASSLSLSISTTNLSLGANTISITGFVAGCGVSSFGTVLGINNPAINSSYSLSNATICSGSPASLTLSGSQL